MPTRRKFLLNCSAAAVTASLLPAAALATDLKQVPLDNLGFQSFLQNLNTVFRVRDNATGVADLRLIDAQLLTAVGHTLATAPDASYEKFSLLFAGSLDRSFSQDTYWFEHPRLGRFAMFVVPVGVPDSAQSYYQAVFNRPVSGRSAPPVSTVPAGTVLASRLK